MPPPRRKETEGFEKLFYATASFVWKKQVGDEVYGDCPICGGTDKLYVNRQSGEWSCKAGRSEQLQIHTEAGAPQEGNHYDWLLAWCSFCDYMYGEDAPWDQLAADRGIPVDTLKDSGMTWDGEQWLIPIYNLKTTLVGLARYGETTVNSKGHKEVHFFGGTTAGLFNLAEITGKPKGTPIYLCEGFWDATSLQYQLGDSGVAVGLPGAKTFKKEWIDFFAGHPIVGCLDNDAAGEEGQNKAFKMLAGVCQDIKQVTWPSDTAIGYDMRDWFKDGRTLGQLLDLIELPSIAKDLEAASALLFDRPFGMMDFEKEVLPVFSSYLHLTDDIETAVRIAYATIISNQIPGDPLWVQIVAPPGGTKTEILRAAGGVSNTMFLSTLRPASLISGWKQGDPSVLPQLSGKTLVVRDLTEVLADTEANQRQVFGILRQSYDGEVYYAYGQNVIRHYKDLWFSVLAGVTPEIFANPMASLGERFLVYHSIKGANFDDTLLVERASNSKGNESGMRDTLQEITKEFLETKIEGIQVPTIPQEYLHKLVYLAKITAKLRGTVARHKYRNDVILYPPQHEVATRLVKQLTRLAVCLSMLEPGMQFNDRVYSIVKRVATDSCNAFNMQISQLLAASHGGMSETDIETAINLPHDTVRARLDDMRRLGSVISLLNPNPPPLGSKYMYDLTDEVKKFWGFAGLGSLNGYRPGNPLKEIGVIRLDRGTTPVGIKIKLKAKSK